MDDERFSRGICDNLSAFSRVWRKRSSVERRYTGVVVLCRPLPMCGCPAPSLLCACANRPVAVDDVTPVTRLLPDKHAA
jgi:hypothetical protein